MRQLTTERIAELHSEVVRAARQLLPARNIMHREMGKPDDFPCCDGRGWAMEARPGTENDEIPDVLEVYCHCEAGQERKRLEGVQ